MHGAPSVSAIGHTIGAKGGIRRSATAASKSVGISIPGRSLARSGPVAIVAEPRYNDLSSSTSAAKVAPDIDRFDDHQTVPRGTIGVS